MRRYGGSWMGVGVSDCRRRVGRVGLVPRGLAEGDGDWRRGREPQVGRRCQAHALRVCDHSSQRRLEDQGHGQSDCWRRRRRRDRLPKGSGEGERSISRKRDPGNLGATFEQIEILGRKSPWQRSCTSEGRSASGAHSRKILRTSDLRSSPNMLILRSWS